MSIYVVKALSENYEVTRDIVLVNENKEEAFKVARKQADDSDKGSELDIWWNGSLLETKTFHDRHDVEVIFSRIPHPWSFYTTVTQLNAKRSIESGIDIPVVLITDSTNFKEYLEDYDVKAEITEMTMNEYLSKYPKEPLEHYLICNYFDEHKLPRLKEEG